MKFKLSTEKEREQVIDYIRCLPYPKDSSKTQFYANITRSVPKRTISQNNLYWIWIACIRLETGNEKNDVHDELRRMFLGYEDYLVFGEQRERLISTTSLNTVKMGDYLNRIQVWAAEELGIVLPDPSASFWEAFYDQYSSYI